MFDALHAGLTAGTLVPYLGPGVLALADPCPIPGTAAELVARLTARATVPHKLRGNLTGAAQFIENFKHRKTLVAGMKDAFRDGPGPTALHRFLAEQPALKLLVHAWYDDLPQKALAGRDDWGAVQGVSQSEYFGNWNHYFRADGTRVGPEPTAETESWATLLYQPLGSFAPAANFLVSDTDFVEVLTEIDIQTPIPAPVQSLRRGRNFLFLGCRFANQLERSFARQIMKRSSDHHWAVLPGELTRNEQRFLEEQNITRLDLSLDGFLAEVSRQPGPLAASA